MENQPAGRSRIAYVALCIVLTGCGTAIGDNESSATATPSSTTVTTSEVVIASTSTTPATTAAVPETTTTWIGPNPVVLAVTKTAGLEYMDQPKGWHKPVMDVFAADGAGPWPVVVLFHGDPSAVANWHMESLARHLAERGAVVFNTNWGSREPYGTHEREQLSGQGPCAYWYAHENAETYGGDPTDISLAGFSAGANMAAATVMYGGGEDLGCAARPVPIEPSKVVYFEGDTLLSPVWDQALRADPTLYTDLTPWRYINDYAGPPIHFLIDRQTAAAYTAPSTDDYLNLRDPNSELRADLAAMGALDDGVLDIGEGTTLFHRRLLDAGTPTTLTWIDHAVHRLSPPAIDAITQLLLADNA